MRKGEAPQEEAMDCRQSDTSEDYVTTFMDKSLVTDWDKLNPEVRIIMFWCYVVIFAVY